MHFLVTVQEKGGGIFRQPVEAPNQRTAERIGVRRHSIYARVLDCEEQRLPLSKEYRNRIAPCTWCGGVYHTYRTCWERT